MWIPKLAYAFQVLAALEIKITILTGPLAPHGHMLKILLLAESPKGFIVYKSE
jgi:hypothetical protein